MIDFKHMNELDTKQINQLIDAHIQAGKVPEKLEIGFKTYARLVDSDDFYRQVSKSGDGKHRLYRNIRIKLVTEKHFLKVK